MLVAICYNITKRLVVMPVHGHAWKPSDAATVPWPDRLLQHAAPNTGHICGGTYTAHRRSMSRVR